MSNPSRINPIAFSAPSETPPQDYRGPVDASPHAEWIPHLMTASSMADRLCRRKGIFGADREDFQSWALVRLLDRECAILKKYRGESSFQGFLAAVLANLLKDYQNHRWGKWRASAAAKRSGDLAVGLEALVYRDGLPLREAVQRLQSEGHELLTIRQATALLHLLPCRYRRTWEGMAAIERLESSECADASLAESERERELRRVRRALDESLRDVDPQDRLILRLRYEEGMTVADIARSLDLEQKPLYRRIERLLARLKKSPALQEVRRDDGFVEGCEN